MRRPGGWYDVARRHPRHRHPPRLSPTSPSLLPPAVVADDDPAMRRVLARLTARAGFAVVEAHDGQAALRAAETQLADGRPPALLVADVQMPGLAGVALAACAAALVPGMRVLLTSGAPLPADAACALAGVHYTFLPKPFAITAFDAALATLGARG